LAIPFIRKRFNPAVHREPASPPVVYAGMALRSFVLPGVTWLLLLALYCVLAGGTSLEEVASGTIAALLATAVATAVRCLAERQLRLGYTAWLNEVGVAARDILAGTAKVARTLCRLAPPEGGFLRRSCPFRGDDAERAGWFALKGLGISVSPNTFVIWELQGKQELLLHCLPLPDQRRRP
jgi:hypothetical protein